MSTNLFQHYDLKRTSFNNVPGVYVIYTSQKYLDVGETNELGRRILSHERRACWEQNASGKTIYLSFLRESNSLRRLNIEADLRERLNPSCGSR